MDEQVQSWNLGEVRWSLARAGIQVERYSDDEIAKDLYECHDMLRVREWGSEAEFRQAVIKTVTMRLDGHDFNWFASQEHANDFLSRVDRYVHPSDPFWRAFLFVITGAGAGPVFDTYLKGPAIHEIIDHLDEHGGFSGTKERMIRIAIHLWNGLPFKLLQNMQNLDAYDTNICLEGIKHILKNTGVRQISEYDRIQGSEAQRTVDL